jgi:hypothetical protein
MIEELIETLREQSEVGFTGKVNLLRPSTKQYHGSCVFQDGELIHVNYRSLDGMKGFYKLFIDASEGVDIEGIVEPEIVDHFVQNIHYPLTKLVQNLKGVLIKYHETKDQKPPVGVKLMVKPEFFASEHEITSEEFDLMCTISDYSDVSEIYKKSKLLDFEITNALVNLRKKDALKVVK